MVADKMQTSFEYTHTTQLPLPPPKNGEDWDSIAQRGIEVALELLHDPDVMIKHDSTHLKLKSIHADADQAVSVHELADRFNVPLNSESNPVASRDVHESAMVSVDDWHHFEVSEQIPIMFGMSKQITFQTALRHNVNGMEALTDPGSSVTIHGKYVVEKIPNDHTCLILHEVTITQCSVMLGWYIKATMGKAHTNVHAYFKERFVERMSARQS